MGLFRVIINSLVGVDGFGEPDVAADGAVIADIGIAAQNGSVGVNNDVVADIGVALDVFDRVAVFVELEAFCA